MGKWDQLVSSMRRHFVRWNFKTIYLIGHSRGVIIDISNQLSLNNCFAVSSDLCVQVFSKELDQSFMIFYLYDPFV